MSVFAWCGADNFHEGGTYRYGTPCPGRTGDGKACDCDCHHRPPATEDAA